MKKNSLDKSVGIALAAVLSCGTVFMAPAALAQAAQTDTAKASTPDPNAPRLAIKEEKIDVGTVAKGEQIHQVFIIKNTGKSDLLITDVKPSCGCTVPEYDKVIKPGGEGKVTLNVDTKAFQGPISKTALLVTNDPTTPQTTLFLTANIKPFVEVLPYGFFRLQALTGENATSDLILVSEEADFKPSRPEVDQTYLKVSLAPASEKDKVPGKAGSQWKVTLTANADAPEGLVGGKVKVQTGIAKQPELELAISGVIKASVTVTPLSVNFGNFDPKGDAMKRRVTLVNNDLKNEGFKVVKAETNVPGVTAEVKPSDTDKARIVVELSVDQKIKKGVFDGEVTIKTNDARRSEVKIPIKGVIL